MHHELRGGHRRQAAQELQERRRRQWAQGVRRRQAAQELQERRRRQGVRRAAHELPQWLHRRQAQLPMSRRRGWPCRRPRRRRAAPGERARRARVRRAHSHTHTFSVHALGPPGAKRAHTHTHTHTHARASERASERESTRENRPVHRYDKVLEGKWENIEICIWEGGGADCVPDKSSFTGGGAADAEPWEDACSKKEDHTYIAHTTYNTRTHMQHT